MLGENIFLGKLRMDDVLSTSGRVGALRKGAWNTATVRLRPKADLGVQPIRLLIASTENAAEIGKMLLRGTKPKQKPMNCDWVEVGHPLPDQRACHVTHA